MKNLHSFRHECMTHYRFSNLRRSGSWHLEDGQKQFVSRQPVMRVILWELRELKDILIKKFFLFQPSKKEWSLYYTLSLNISESIISYMSTRTIIIISTS